MKIKKRLKYKSTLPKADYSMDPNALSNMNKQAAEETPAQGKGMGAAMGMNIASQGLNFISSLTPQDNDDGIGMSHKASKITSGISGGLDTASSIAGSINPIAGAAFGGVSALFKMIKGAVDHKRENDRSITSRLARKEYDPTQDNVGYSFGTPAAKNGMVLNSPQQPKVKLDFDMERQLPSDLAYERDVNKFDYNFVKNNVPKELQEYQQGLPLPNNYRIYKTPKGYYNVYDEKNTNIGYSQDGKNYIKGEPQFKNGGKPVAQNTIDIDSTLNANKNLNWVDRLYQKNTPTIFLPGESQPSTHYMESADNFVYPTIIQNEDGKLDYLGNKAYDYAMKTNTAIKFKTPEEAEYFAKNYKNGKNVLKGFKKSGQIEEFELGGDPRSQSNIEAEQGEAMQHSSGKIENIEGEKHENGGTPLQVQPSHEYIYSDSLGYDKQGNMTLNEKDVKKSFADKAKSIQKKYSSREGDSIVDKTKQLELGLLKKDAEQARVAKEEIEMGKQMKKYKAKYGANLKRFDNSGNPQGIMTPEEMKAMYQSLQTQADATSKGLDQTITDFQQTAKQMDENAKIANGQVPYVQPATSSTSSTASQVAQPLFGGGNRINPFVGPRVPSRRDNLREAANFYTPGQVGTPKPIGTAQDRQTDIAPDAVKKNGFFGDLTTGDKMQLASMLPAFGFNMGMGLRKADVEPNRKNPYENDVLSMMANRKFDIQNYLNQSNLATNTAKEDIGNNSTSVGGKMANLQKLFANQSNALGDITTKGQEMNNQYRAEEANTKNIIGEANRAESIRAAGINDQNKARKQQFLAKAFEQMGQGIATTGQSANQSLTNKLLIKSLSEISPDFDVKNMKDLQVGDDGYIVFKGVKTEFKMSDEGKIVMAGGTPNTANAAKSQYAPKEFTMSSFANFTKPKKK